MKIKNFEQIHSLTMLKMEKHFMAIIERGYPYYPYMVNSTSFLIRRAYQELEELQAAYESGDYENTRVECADISNIIDYIFERLSNNRGIRATRDKATTEDKVEHL